MTETEILARALTTTRDVGPMELPTPHEGSVPAELDGVLFRNGPGRFARDVPYGHPFDGDGFVTRFELREGRVRYAGRFVRTRELQAEERAGRVLFRGFGTNLPGGARANAMRLRFKNAANTHVVAHGGKLLALWEGGWPHALDPVTLETLGRSDFDGRLQNHLSVVDRLLSPELPFAAHCKRDEASGELVGFGLALGARPRLLLYRVDANGVMRPPRVVTLPELSFIHDMGLTRKWMVFIAPRVHFQLGPVLLGRATPVESLRIRDGAPMQVLLVPRDGGDAVTIDTSLPGFAFHVAQAFENDDGQVVCDAMVLDAFPDLRTGQPILEHPRAASYVSRPVRLILDPIARTCRHVPIAEHGLELPTVASGSPASGRRFVFGTATPRGVERPYYSALARVDTATGRSLMRDFHPDLPGEPIVVDKPGAHASETDAWVVSVVYRAAEHASDLVILDASDLSTVAAIRLPHHLPPGLHGSWVPRAQLGPLLGPRAEHG